MMTISFKNALEDLPLGLKLLEKRSELLASNLANADTPDYKARDLDFKAIMEKAISKTQTPESSSSLKQTDSKHLAGFNSFLEGPLMYRVPFQPSLDGNTVETHIEQAKFAENAVQYQFFLGETSGTFKNLLLAIKGQ